MSVNDHSNLRKDQRQSTSFQARFIVGENAIDCDIIDISIGGAKLKARANADLNTPGMLDLDRIGKLSAEAVWCRGGAIGIKFKDDPERVSNAVMALAMFGAG